MTFKNFLAASAAAIATTTAFTAIPTPVMAQQITSEIRGFITDEAGAPVSGASVTVTDTRTGGSRTYTTGSDGSYSARNLSVGGPYTVTVSAAGRQGQVVEDVFVSVASQTNISLALSTASGSDEIVVVSSRRNTQELAIGPSSTFGLETLESLPSISRDIRDIIRIDPRVTVDGGDDNVSCLGGSSRAASFTIDGINSTDTFGLNSSGLPARANFPIPFDSIQETAVEFSPYDVEYANFTACNINIVTKRGTNEFHGSAFAVFNSSGLTGSRVDDIELSQNDFRDYNWGASVGGPIIKDKLFFFAAYEEIDDGGNIITSGPQNAGFSNPVDNLNLADTDELAQIARDVYGLEPGGLARAVPETSRRILGRIDWLINDDHRLELLYSRERELEVESDLTDADFQFGNSLENSGSRIERYSGRLFSQWNDNFTTELRLSRTDNQDIQNPVGGGEAQDANPIPRLIVEGNALGSFQDGAQVTGPGTFRSANDLQTTIDQLRAKGDYSTGAHTFTFGYDYNRLEVFNLFVPLSTGEFRFDDAAAFAAGTANFIEFAGSSTGDINDAAADWSRTVHSFFAQDTWRPTDALALTFGLRYDFYASGDNPRESQTFIDRYGFTNAEAFDSLEIIQPRFGLTYEAGPTFFGETSFRMGAGVFSGGDPTVFFSNAFTNDSFGTARFDNSDAGCSVADLQVIDTNGAFTGVPDCITSAVQAAAGAGTGRTDALDPDLKLPSIIRGSLGLTHFTDFSGGAGGFFDDWTVNLDLIYTANRNEFSFVDLTLTPTGEFLPDGRPVFNAVDPLLPGCNATFNGDLQRPAFNGTTAELSNGGACDAGFDDQDILLTNVAGRGDNGRSYAFSAQFQKSFDYELFQRPASWDLGFGYAYTDTTAVTASLSSTATSNFEETATAILNRPVAGPSRFVNRHVVTLRSSFRQEFLPELPTAISVFVSAREGQPFSYAYDNNTPTTLFGDSDNEERNLFYVPTGPNDPLVQFGNNIDVDNFFNFLEASGLNEFAGQIAPRGAFRDPWFVDVDLRFQQDLPNFINGLRTIAYVDVENVLNLIDSGSNVLRTFDRGDVGEAVPVLDAALSPDGTQFIYSNFPTGELGSFGDPSRSNDQFDRATNASLWAIQFGLRFEF